MTFIPPEPRLARLADLVEDRLSLAEAAVVLRQIADGGPRANYALRWTKDFLSLAAAVPLHDPPPAVRDRLLRSFNACQKASAALANASLEVTLALLFDSSRDPVLAGTRSGDRDDDVVHLAYSSEPADLVLDISSTAADTLRIDGQVLPLDSGVAGSFRSLLTHGGEPRAASCDSFGRFTFEGVRPGPQRLRAGNGRLMLVADLDLRERCPISTVYSTLRSTEASRGAS